MKNISIIIPTLNEAGNIKPLAGRIFETARTSSLEYEIIFVDDGSTDGTQDVIRSLNTEMNVRLICREGEKGLSSAVIRGAEKAKNEIVVVMDADLSHPPETIPELVRPIADGTRDMMLGSRYVRGGSTPDWPLKRKAASKLATLPARIFTDVRDPLSGFFSVRRDIITGLKKNVEGFKIALELLASGGEPLRVDEIPIEFRERNSGKSKMGLTVIYEYLKQLAALSGANVSLSSGSRFAVTGCIGLAVDLAVFHILSVSGASLAAAHILSFLAAASLNYLLNSRWSFKNISGRNRKNVTAFFTIAVLALVIRGGILAALTRIPGFPLYLAAITAIGAASALNYAGCAFFVFGNSGAGRQNAFPRIMAVGIIGYSIILRLVYMGLAELLHEEAYYWNYAKHLALGYLDHPPMVSWLIALSTGLFGNTEFAVRLPAFACWTVTMWFSYSLALSMSDRTTAFKSLLVCSVLPFYFGTGFIMTPDAPLTACWAGALFYLKRALVDGKNRAWTGFGIFLGLGMLSKYTIVLLGPAAVIFAAVDKKSRRWFLRPEPYIAAVVAIALFSPVIIWNADNGWASFVFQGPRRVGGSFDFSLPDLLASILILITPVGFMTAMLFFFKKSVFMHRSSSNVQSSEYRCYRFALITTAVPLSVFIVFGFFRSVKLNWTGPLWLAVIPYMAMLISGSAGKPVTYGRLHAVIRRSWFPAVMTCLLIYGAGLHYLVLGLPGIRYAENLDLVGWEDLGHKVEKITDAYESRTGEKPLVVGMDKYKTASGMAFYLSKISGAEGRSADEAVNRTSGRHLFNRESLMYRYWLPAGEIQSGSLLLLSPKPDDLSADKIKAFAQSTGELKRIEYSKNGKKAGDCYYRIVRGYGSSEEKKTLCANRPDEPSFQKRTTFAD